MGNKYSDEGSRLCDADSCELIATHWLVWTKPQVYCIIHANKMLGIADVMGHPTPASTVRLLTPDEMFQDDPAARGLTGGLNDVM